MVAATVAEAVRLAVTTAVLLAVADKEAAPESVAVTV